VPSEDIFVYVVFDKMFPNKFHSKFYLQAGEEDVELYTYPKYNPFKGNPFGIYTQ
jgi:hypothetical protein